MIINECFKRLTNIEWSNLEEVAKIVPSVLTEISHNKKELKKAILNINLDDELFALCEHYDILDKLVIFSDQNSHKAEDAYIFARLL